ncbi:hypothetical protein LEAN103870_05030 [Legionella anisa]|uniref:Uncharacterized protein n=3 Tax=Legionella anisa TaxID=28082 RepID=A0AAX0WSW8_9GAMM|nr:hypothetical protein [Legionella anisa]AWN73138.1 hypothetical protein DLD14_04390 [Legionella anisa]KTC67427.1 coiled-coil-containing protein [Legionella anisa]MBN5936107.1 hypothetical protein [Legionella anisa]MCW8423968.1 hypothetical protein [Legionella anisa]MCW8447490.1 hypothetical protein [Legionella anisa]
MPYPKISAVLNNCPLHTITPELVQEIYHFAKDEHYNNQHNDAYAALKRNFAEFYGFDPNAFSWKLFAGILKQYNPFDIQIMMGPVLRGFMAVQLGKPGIYEKLPPKAGRSKANAIEECTEIDRTARYTSLEQDELAILVCNPFGFSLRYIPQEGDEYAATIDPTIPLPNPQCITIYHTGNPLGAGYGGHWERTTNPLEQINYEGHKSTQLLHYSTLLGHDSQVNPTGFRLLQHHVQLTARRLRGEKVDIELCALHNAITLIEKYLKNIQEVPKDLAIRLLGPALKHSQYAREFIQSYEFEAHEFDDQIVQWVGADEEFFKPFLSPEKEELAKKLAAPPALIIPSQLPTPYGIKGERKFYKNLALLQTKITDLEDRKRTALAEANGDENDEDYLELHNAWDTATTLRTELKKQGDIYFANPNQETYKTFRDQSRVLIRTAHGVLDTHRGWSEFLVNCAYVIKGERKFYKNLALLQAKITDLEDRKRTALAEANGDENDEDYLELHNAWDTATILRTELKKQGDIYFANPNQETYKTFRDQSRVLIRTAHGVLDKHRGWSEFLVNLALGISTAGVGIVIKGLINWGCNRSFFFVHQTKSSQVLDKIEDVIVNKADPSKPKDKDDDGDIYYPAPDI